MNAYGHRAMKHWQRWLPKRYSQLEDPETFFERLGQEVSQRVEDLSQGLEGSPTPGESYLEKVGRLNTARQIAVSEAMRELVLIDPEPDADPDGREDWESEAPATNSPLPSN
jgi:hypothetical protein